MANAVDPKQHAGTFDWFTGLFTVVGDIIAAVKAGTINPAIILAIVQEIVALFKGPKPLPTTATRDDIVEALNSAP